MGRRRHKILCEQIFSVKVRHFKLSARLVFADIFINASCEILDGDCSRVRVRTQFPRPEEIYRGLFRKFVEKYLENLHGNVLKNCLVPEVVTILQENPSRTDYSSLTVPAIIEMVLLLLIVEELVKELSTWINSSGRCSFVLCRRGAACQFQNVYVMRKGMWSEWLIVCFGSFSKDLFFVNFTMWTNGHFSVSVSLYASLYCSLCVRALVLQFIVYGLSPSDCLPSRESIRRFF